MKSTKVTEVEEPKPRKPRVASEMLEKKLIEKKKKEFFKNIEQVLEDTSKTPEQEQDASKSLSQFV